MAIIKCRECGRDISSQAEACPNCGYKNKTRIGFWGVIAIVVAVVWGIVELAPRRSQPPADQVATNEPIGTPAATTNEVVSTNSDNTESLKHEAMATLEVTNWKYQKSESGLTMNVSVKLKNNGSHDLKDFEITCKDYSSSLTQIDRNKKTVYELLPHGKTLNIKAFSMGFVHSQTTKVACEVTDLVVL